MNPNLSSQDRDHELPHSDTQPAPGQASYPPAHGSNPYYTQSPAAAVPDLDAGAPVLRSSEVQRLNRKALYFLAGIIALLVVAAIWMFAGSTSNGEGAAKPREEAVVIPDLPSVPESAPLATAEEAAQPATTPIPVLPSPPPHQQQIEPPASMSEPAGPTLRERRMANNDNGIQAPPGPDPYVQAMLASVNPNAAAASGPQRDVATSARHLSHPDALMVRGTYIRCVLETRIITDIPGFTSCIVTEPVYSINGRRLLLPKGSKVYGKYNSDANGPRVSVIWDRITTPTGIDVAMSSPGVDQLGGAGHPGDYNAHWGSRMGSALLISLISDAFKYMGAKEGPTTTTVTNGVVTQSPFESNTARTMESLANQALEQAANRPATVTINQGTIVNVYVAKDIDFSAVLPQS